MLTIPRTDFQAAIEAGIDNSPTLIERERERLRQVGRDELSVGTNFSTGCPATLAGLCVAGDVPDRAADFACAYDDRMSAVAPMRYGFVKRVRIV